MGSNSERVAPEGSSKASSQIINKKMHSPAGWGPIDSFGTPTHKVFLLLEALSTHLKEVLTPSALEL